MGLKLDPIQYAGAFDIIQILLHLNHVTHTKKKSFCEPPTPLTAFSWNNKISYL